MAWVPGQPQGTTRIKASDDFIRANWAALQAFLNVEHMPFAASGAASGIHANYCDITTRAVLSGALSGASALTGRLAYTTDTEELFVGSGGGWYHTGIPSGSKMIFYQDTAPAGWTIQNTLDDRLIYVSKGSAAGGEEGGGELSGTVVSSGTWTQPDHTLVIAEMPSHSHNILVSSTNYNTRLRKLGYSGDEAWQSDWISDTGGDQPHNHGSTWRPASLVCIIARKE